MQYKSCFLALPLMVSSIYAQASIPAKPNLILIIVDDLGSVFAVPLASDQPIGPNAAGYAWLTAAESTGGSALLSASRSGGIGPPLTIGYFAGLESTYIGIEFYDNQQPDRN